MVAQGSVADELEAPRGELRAATKKVSFCTPVATHGDLLGHDKDSRAGVTSIWPIEVQTHAPQQVQEENNPEAAGQEHVHVTSDTQRRKTATNYKDTTPARHYVEDAKEDLA